MKFFTTISRVKILYIAAIIALSFSNINSDVVYETPVIRGHGLSENYNPRIEAAFKTSAENYERYLQRKVKNRAHNDVIRSFSSDTVEKLVKVYEEENLQTRTFEEIINSAEVMLGKSIDLQQYVNYLSNIVVKKLALLDVKIKQIGILDKALDLAQTGDNIVKSTNSTQLETDQNASAAPAPATASGFEYEKLDRFLTIIASTNSLYDVNYNTICEILKRANHQLDNEVPEALGGNPKKTDADPKVVEYEQKESDNNEEVYNRKLEAAKGASARLDRDKKDLDEGLSKLKNKVIGEESEEEIPKVNTKVNKKTETKKTEKTVVKKEKEKSSTAAKSFRFKTKKNYFYNNKKKTNNITFNNKTKHYKKI